MIQDLLSGEKVRLVVPNVETDAEYLARWGRDSEYQRLLDFDPARQWSIGKHKEWLVKDMTESEKNNSFLFMIHTLADDHLIGLVGLDGILWNHGTAWVGIGIGERQYWGKGYGTDAMRTILRYGFDELNLHRVSLNVFEYNPRAIRSYEKTGFVIEGQMRHCLRRDGRRWDLIYMGILREDWERNHRKFT
jgi:RimJ/RimL family protein N-acetyltransferase